MSRIMGDSLVAGPESTSAPEVVTVRLTRGMAKAIDESLVELARRLHCEMLTGEERYVLGVLGVFRSEIGGSR